LFLFQFLDVLKQRDDVDFSKWEVFYADERCVPPDHEDSNHRLLEEWLLGEVEVGGVHFLSNPEDVADSALQYQTTILSTLPTPSEVRKCEVLTSCW